MKPAEYLDAALAELIISPLVVSFDVIEQWVEPDRGYLRVRAQLTNGDFLELAEYFVASGESCTPERYRYQWMDGTRQVLRKRWDNIEHYPELPGFPHHVHLAGGQVEPSDRLSILDVLQMLASETLE